MTIAFVFPGQGAQEVGMGRAMAEASPAARAAFDEADRALGLEPALSRLCFDGPLDQLTLTANTQPAILATSIACYRALRERVPSLAVAMMAGHSLGEYSALVASGAMDFADTVRLVRQRGQFMQDAVPPGTGAMAALVGLDAEAVAAICAQVGRELEGRTVAAANYNAPGQVVIAGHADAIARAVELAAEHKGKAIPLKVSAPFHCALMRRAAEQLGDVLAPMTVRDPSCPVVANFDALPNAHGARVKELLVQQVAGPVRWEQCVRAMVAGGVDRFVEVGPGKVLAGLVKRIAKGVTIHNVSDPASLEAFAASVA